MFRKSLEDFINSQRSKLEKEKLKLGVINNKNQEKKKNDCGNRFDSYSNNREQFFFSEGSETSDIYVEDEQKMLNIGEFSPNNPKMRVATQPYLGLGEYDDHRRQMLNDQRKSEYQQYAEKARCVAEDNAFLKNHFRGSGPGSNSRSNSADKAVQTDIQNVHSKLVHYEAASGLQNPNPIERQIGRAANVDKIQHTIADPLTGYNKYMDSYAATQATSPRTKLMADLQSSCFPSGQGYKPQNSVDNDRFEKVRKQEIYLAELQQQVKEKQMLVKKHKEEEKLEQELETIRLETQMRNLQTDKKPNHRRYCYSSDLPTAINTQDYDNKSDQTYNRNTKMNETRLNSRAFDSRATHYSNYNTSKYTNSPPLLSKRNRPPYSFNIQPNSVFANSVPVKKRNSKLVLNINNSHLTTKDNHSRFIHSNTNKLEESLPIPVLKAQSPVAKELINALPVQSRTSDAMRKLEDKWQIPAVQKNIIKTSERPIEGNNQGVLTQLGAIRLQLQQEQLRLDETLRKRGTTQSQQTIIRADIHRNLHY